MSRRRVWVDVICEDKMTKVFAERFLKSLGWSRRDFHVEPAPKGKGAADSTVLHWYPKYLKAHRFKRTHRGHVLVVFVDGDRFGVKQRMRALDSESRTSDDCVVLCVPTRNILGVPMNMQPGATSGAIISVP